MEMYFKTLHISSTNVLTAYYFKVENDRNSIQPAALTSTLDHWNKETFRIFLHNDNILDPCVYCFQREHLGLLKYSFRSFGVECLI